MIDHLMVGDSEEIGFAFLHFHDLPVLPKFLKCRLDHVPRVFFLPEILQDEAVDIVRIKPYTFVVFFLCHKHQGRSVTICNTMMATGKLQPEMEIR
jgi:hypothetical protein